jgi:hypothetical protein
VQDVGVDGTTWAQARAAAAVSPHGWMGPTTLAHAEMAAEARASPTPDHGRYSAPLDHQCRVHDEVRHAHAIGAAAKPVSTVVG